MLQLDAYLVKQHLDDDEDVMRIVHRHWALGVRAVLWPTISILISLFLLYAAPVKLVLFVAGTWLVVSFVWFARNFLRYYLDVWIITSRGVIDLAWLGWFHRQSARVLYSDIQGVSYEVQGVFGTFLKFGSVTIEKISNSTLISLGQVPNPRSVEVTILSNMETYLHAKNMKNSKQVQELLSTFIAEQFQLERMQKQAPAQKEPPEGSAKRSGFSLDPERKSEPPTKNAASVSPAPSLRSRLRQIAQRNMRTNGTVEIKKEPSTVPQVEELLLKQKEIPKQKERRMDPDKSTPQKTQESPPKFQTRSVTNTQEPVVRKRKVTSKPKKLPPKKSSRSSP